MNSAVSDRLLNEFADAASRITTVKELRAYAEHFPSPEAGRIIVAALTFLSEPKVIDGKRDGRKIYQHSSLGYGLRLKGNESLLPPSNWMSGYFPGRDILIAISLYTQKEWPKKHELRYSERIQNKKYYGVEEPEELVYVFINLLSDQLRKKL